LTIEVADLIIGCLGQHQTVSAASLKATNSANSIGLRAIAQDGKEGIPAQASNLGACSPQ
jgi:hypothetical protein